MSPRSGKSGPAGTRAASTAGRSSRAQPGGSSSRPAGGHGAPGAPGARVTHAAHVDRRRGAQERRGAGRVPATFAVSEANGSHVHLCQAEDIATGGITIKHARGLAHQPRTEVALRFALPGSREEIHTRGEIVSDSRVGSFRRTGVRFIALCPEHEQLIAAYISRR